MNEVEDLPFETDQGHSGAATRPRKLDRKHLPYVRWSRREEDNPIGEKGGFFDIMGDKEDRLRQFLPDRKEPILQTGPRQCVERT